MNSAFFTMSMLINKKLYAHILYNTECLFYEMITFHFAKNHNLQHIVTGSQWDQCSIDNF